MGFLLKFRWSCKFHVKKILECGKQERIFFVFSIEKILKKRIRNKYCNSLLKFPSLHYFFECKNVKEGGKVKAGSGASKKKLC